MILEMKNVDAGYGQVQVLRQMSLGVAAGEILCLLGRNGAGKTTALKAIMGLVRTQSGEITMQGQRLDRLPAWKVPGHGIGYIPQGRRLFAELTVEENLRIGLMTRRKGAATRARVLEMFPRLSERLDQPAGSLSGGEQQMLATARALCLEPKVLLLDEPTEGLQPSMIALIRDAVQALAGEGVAVVLVEQRIEAVLEIADRVVFIENGRAAESVTPQALRDTPELLHKYVGV